MTNFIGNQLTIDLTNNKISIEPLDEGFAKIDDQQVSIHDAAFLWGKDTQQQHGWDEEGIATRSILFDYGLDDIVTDLEQHGLHLV